MNLVPRDFIRHTIHWSLAFSILFAAQISLGFDDFESSEEEEIIENPLSATLTVKDLEIPAGAQSSLTINMTLAEGYHAYLDKFKLTWGEDSLGFKIGPLDISPITEFKDAFSGEMKKGVENSGVVKAVFEVPADYPKGETTAKFQLTYQACTAKHCLFPKKIPLSAKLVIKDGTADIKVASGSLNAKDDDSSGGGVFTTIGKAFRGELSFGEAVAEGVFFSFIFIFLAGILTSFTPCIYPMIPITLAVIGAKSKDQTKAKSLSLSIVYVLGIALTFSSLGVVAALTGSLFGSALSNPIVVGTLAAIFVVLGLSMYGVFELQAPAGLRNKLGTQKNTGYFGALFAGLVSGIVAGPCVGPVLIGVLTYVGEKQDAVYGFSLLFTYAVGMGLLFIGLGTSSSLLNKLPRAGGWMDGVKFLFGTIMIAMAIYYIAPLASDRVFYTCLALALILISSSYGAFVPNEGLSQFGRLKKGVMLTSFILGVIFMIQAVFGANLLSGLAAGANAGQSAKIEKLPWQPYSDSALEQAKQSGKPVIVDFFAEWCVACKELEMFTFTAPEVKELAKDFALLKFDATEDSDELVRLKKKYKILGLPTVLFIDAQGKVNSDLTLTGFEEGDAFSERMKKTKGS